MVDFSQSNGLDNLLPSGKKQPLVDPIVNSQKPFSNELNDRLQANPGINGSLSSTATPWNLNYSTAANASEQAGGIVFIDAGVKDYQTLIAGLKPGTEVAVLDPTRNEVEQIGKYLAGRSGISSLHIISHGESGSLQLGGTKLGLDNLKDYASEIQHWRGALKPGGDILLYGCDVAEGEKGKMFVQQLSQLTQADVAASDDLTGNARLGGDWTLEFSTGSIETSQIFKAGALAAYQSTLAVGPDGSSYLATSTSFQPNLNLVPGNPGVVTITALNSVDDVAAPLDLGANTFRFYGQTYTGNNQLFVSENGLITFGTANARYVNDDLTSGLSQAAIAPAWDDWVTYVNTAPDDLVLYQFQDLNNDGTNDQLVVEWNNVHHFSNNTAGDATYQAILQLNTGSTNGNIIFNYSDLSIPNTNLDEAGSATVGIKAAGTQGSNRLLISQNTTASPYVGTGRAILVTNQVPLLDLNGEQTQAATGINYSTSFAQGGGAVSIVDSTNLSLVDPDSSNLTSATVTITNPLDRASEVLAANTQGTSITAAYNSTTGALTLTGSDTVANYQQVLRSITYNNTAANPNSTSRSISFVVSDGTNTSPVATSTVGINAPLLDLNGTATGINYTNYFPGGAAVAAVDRIKLTITDVDNPNLSSATVGISNLRNGASEVLAANTTNTNIISLYNPTTGVLTLSGTDTIANYQQVLRSITYINTAVSPDTRDRLLNFTVSDGNNNSPIAITTIKFGTRPNSPPSLSLSSQTISYTENDPATAIDTTATAIDPDTDNFNGSTLRVSSVNGLAEDILGIQANAQNQIEISANNTIRYQGTPIGNFTGGTDGVTPLEITFNSDAATDSVVNAVLQNITYRNTSENPSTVARTISFELTDQQGSKSQTVNKTINITPQNDAPDLVENIDNQTAQEDAAFNFQLPSNTFTDVDGDNLTYSAKLATGEALPSWLEFNSDTRTFSATPRNENVGTHQIRVTATDPSGTTDSDTFTVTVNNTNDAPVANVDQFATDRSKPITISSANLLSNDTDVDGDSLSIIRLSQTQNGTLVANNDDTFTYTPDIYFQGADSLTYTVIDGNGGTATSSVNLAVNPVGSTFSQVELDKVLNTRQNEPSNFNYLTFDDNFYLRQNPDVAQAVRNGVVRSGLDHFQRYGEAEGRDPGILFNYLIFDEGFYLKQNPDVAQAVKAGIVSSGFDHFQRYGEAQGRKPSILFDEDYYLKQNPDVAQAVKAGIVSSGFDHFKLYGDAEGRNPSSLFDNSRYYADNPDVAQAVRNKAFDSGFNHYLRYGQFEGRQPNLELFNESYYLANNPDVAEAVTKGVVRSGFDHFIRYGEAESRNPSSLFDNNSYLAKNPDVAEAIEKGIVRSGCDHYIRYGKAQGRSA